MFDDGNDPWQGIDSSYANDPYGYAPDPTDDASTVDPYGDTSQYPLNNADVNPDAYNPDGTLSDTSTGIGGAEAAATTDPTAESGAASTTGRVGSGSPGTGVSLGKPPSGGGGGAPAPTKAPTSNTYGAPRPSYIPPNPRYSPRSPIQAAVDPRGYGGSFPIYNANANIGNQPIGPGAQRSGSTTAGSPIAPSGISPQILLYAAIGLAFFALVK